MWAAVQTAVKEQQRQQRFPSTLILKPHVPSAITHILCRIYGAFDERRLQKETAITGGEGRLLEWPHTG